MISLAFAHENKVYAIITILKCSAMFMQALLQDDKNSLHAAMK